MATSVPVPMAMPRSACASAGASFTPSPTTATRWPSACSARTTSTFSPGSTSATTRSMPDLGRDRVGGRLAVAGDHDRLEPELVQRGDRVARRRLHGVGHDERGRGTVAVPAREHDGAALVVGRASATASSASGDRADERRPRPTRTSTPSTVGLDAAARRRSRTRSARRARAPRARAPSATARAIGCSDASSTEPARRSSVVGVDAGRGDDVDQLHAALGDGAGLVEHRGVDPLVASSTSPPLITMPSWAPRPVPTMIAVGVARPSAHGQAMISTATAAVNASSAAWPVQQPADERADRDHEHDRHEHRRDAVGQPLHRRLRALGLLDQPARSGPARCRCRPGSPRRRAGRWC